MEERPKIKLKLTLTDKVIEAMALLGLGFLWFMTISGYLDLPEIIPTHFNASGDVDDYGNKNTILILPVIATILFAGMTILCKFPHVFNYPVEITKENAEQQYYVAARLIRFLKMILVIVFSFIVYQTKQIPTGGTDGLTKWFMPLTLALVLIPILFYLVKSFGAEK